MNTCQHDGCDVQLESGQFCQDHQPAPAAAPAPAPAAAPAAPRTDPALVARVDAIDERMRQLAALGGVPSAAAHPLGAFDSLADYAAQVYRGEADQDLLGQALHDYQVMRAAADQVTGNNPGVLPPSWITDVKRIVDFGRRMITAFGGARSLGATGMEIDWPYLNSSNVLVGLQSSEKTEVTTARVDIAKGSASLVTYAGYSDISYQLLQRSSPSYRDAYNRILLAYWGAVTDAAFVAALESGATGALVASGLLGTGVALANPSAAADDIIDTGAAHGFSIGDAVVFTSLTGGTGLTAGRVYWIIPDDFAAQTFQVSAEPGGAAVDFSTNITAGSVSKVTDTGKRARAALAQASVLVEDATGQPAGIVGVSTDLFLMLAGLEGFQSPEPSGNVSQADGTMLASTLRMESSGLLIQRVPGLSAGKGIVSNREAAAWHEDGPRFATSEDVAKLGQNVGVYSFAAPAVYAPAGVIEVTLI